MKKFTWLVFSLFFAVCGWADNIKMVSYFPIPYASYSDLKVTDTCDVGLMNSCELAADRLIIQQSTATASVPNPALNTGSIFFNVGSLDLQAPVPNNININGESLLVGNSYPGIESHLNISGDLNVRTNFLAGASIKSVVASNSIIASLNLKGYNDTWLTFPTCGEAGNKINWLELTINGVQGVYLVCGEFEEKTCEENPNQQKCCSFSKTENSITYWNGTTCVEKTCASNEYLYSACGIANVTQENLANKNCDLNCIKYQYRWKNVGTRQIVGLRTSDFKECPLEPGYYQGNIWMEYEEPSICASTVVDGRSCTKGTTDCYKGEFAIEKTDGATCTYYYHDTFSCQCEEQGKCD